MGRKKIDIKDKKLFLNFVYLSDEEYQQLCELFGPNGAADWIEQLNDYIGSKGDKYESHYYTVRMWARRAGKTTAAKIASATIGAAAAADRVIELLKNPQAYMPNDELRPALLQMLTARKQNWPRLRALLKENPEEEAKIKAEFLKHYGK